MILYFIRVLNPMVSFMYVSQNVLLFVFLVLFKVFLPEVEGSLLF